MSPGKTLLFPTIPFPPSEEGKDYSKLQSVVRSQEKQIRKSLTFPRMVIEGFAGAFANVYSKVLESPDYAFFMTALTCLGSALAGSVRINTELKSDPRLFTVLVGPSGMSRKSTAADKAITFFTTTLKDFRTCLGAGSAEGLNREITIKPWDKRLLLYYDEFQQFVNKCKIDSSVLLQMVNTLFESNKYENSVSKKGISLDNAYLSFLSASTEDTYEECWENAFTSIGFDNRLFIVPLEEVKRSKSIPPPLSDEVVSNLKEHLLDVIDMVGEEGRVYNLTTDAYNYYDSWYKKLETDKHSIRLESYAMRLMVLLAANDQREAIDLDIVVKTTMLCNWQLAVRRMYDPIASYNPYARMEEKIRRFLESVDEPVTIHMIQNRVHSDRYGLKMFHSALERLRENKEVQKDINDKYSIRTKA